MQMLSRREDCGRQGLIWAGNKLLDDRSQQRGARRKPESVVLGRKCARREGQLCPMLLME